MKVICNRLSGALLSALLIGLVVSTGCDFTSGGDGFNTSRGRADVNFSGTYNGSLSGGRAVERTSGGPITRLVISQQGDALEVLDNNGSRYQGRIGGVSVVTTPDTQAATFEQAEESTTIEAGTISAGTQLAQAQVSWQGNDNVAAMTIEFAGNISAVSVTDIRGLLEQDSQSEGSLVTDTTTTEEEDDGITTITETQTLGVPGSPFFEETETVTVIETDTGRVLSETTTVTGQAAATAITEFILSPQNTQYRLQGTWVEQGGVVAGVEALSAGAAGAIVVGGGSL